MKRIISSLIILMMLTVMISNVGAQEELTIAVGTKVTQIDTNELNNLGYKVVDNTGTDFIYAWPYTLGWVAENANAFGGNALHNAGQVSAQLSYSFKGNYVAVAFCETYYAAKVLIYIDGKLEGEYTPHINDKAFAEKAGESKIVYVNDKLEAGNHLLEIKHEKAYTSGEDNIKGDGQKYYDNDAYFDCVIVDNMVPKAVELGAEINGYTDEVLDKLGYKAVYSDNQNIAYAWPFDLEAAKMNANGRKYRFNLGQVSGNFQCEFEGSYLGVVVAECYYAAKIIIEVDGEKIGEIIPHTDKVTVCDTPYMSKILFVKDNLSGGTHTLKISLETAHTTGEDNIKGDGNAYYDNDAFFDSIIVQKNPDPKATPTTEPTTEPEPTTEVITENPRTDDSHSIEIMLLLILLTVSIVIVITNGYERNKNEKV